MSRITKITVFPEGRSAEEVLAVDLDSETIEYLSTYPGAIRWLRDSEVVRLAEDLGRLGKRPENDPEAIPGLTKIVLPSQGMAQTIRMMLSMLGGSLVLIAVTLFGPESLNVFVRLIIGLGAGLGAAWLVNAPYRKKTRRLGAHDKELKRIYDERLREAADHLVSIDDPDADDVREALDLADAINDNLEQVRRYGLSTLEEAEEIDEHLARLIRAHIAERSTQPRLERLEAVLKDVDSETVAADADLQNIEQQRDELAHTAESARENVSVAKSELQQLDKKTAATARQTEAKLQAAGLRGEETTSVPDATI